MWVFDIDGVVSNSYPLMVSYTEKKLQCTFFQMPYDIYKNSQLSKNEFLFIFNSLVINDLFTPMEGAVSVLTRYQLQIKEPLIFLSHRSELLIDYTIRWLSNYLKVPFKIHSCHELDKVTMAKKYDSRGIIEDQPKICKKFIDNGLQALCYSQPWHKTIENFPSIPIVQNWIDIAERILE